MYFNVKLSIRIVNNLMNILYIGHLDSAPVPVVLTLILFELGVGLKMQNIVAKKNLTKRKSTFGLTT